MQKTAYSLLKLLDAETGASCSTELARILRSQGIDLSERTVGLLLKLLKEKGFPLGAMIDRLQGTRNERSTYWSIFSEMQQSTL